MKRFLRNRWVLSVFAFVVLVAVWWWIDGTIGERQWQQYVAEARARGAIFTFAEAAPKEVIPDEQNYAASPFWRDVFAHPDPAYQALPECEAPRPRAAQVRYWDDFKPTDLAAWRESFSKNGWLAAPDGAGSDAEAALLALEKVKPQLEDIHRGRARRQADCPIDWSKGSEVPLPHARVASAAGRLLRIKAMAELALGRPQGAAETLKDGAAMVRLFESRPNLLLWLLSNGNDGFVVDVLKDGLLAGRWDDAALKEIQGELAARDPLARYIRALQGERLIINTAYEREAAQQQIRKLLWDGSEYRAWWQTASSRSWRELQLYANRAIDDEIADINSSGQFWRASVDRAERERRALEEVGRGLAKLAPAATQNAGTITKSAVCAQARIKMAELACALERCRLAGGGYPGALTDLVPEFISRLPVDPGDGRPFRYRQKSATEYLLYSIGIDGKDDGGKPASWAGGVGDWPWMAVLPK